METVVVNLTGKVRRTTWQGRAYLVAPMSLIVPGVLNGSQGALYYPPDEVARDPGAWNGMPIVVYHPTHDGTPAGRPVSARSPEVLERQGVGTVFATNYGDRLTAEGWFDVEKTRAVDPRVLRALESGTPLELSTGLYTDNHPAQNGANHNGTAYVAVARNHRPDHLAILPDQQGACSLLAGCGVLANAAETEPDERQSIWERLGQLLGLNAVNQPKSAATGHWKRLNAGTGVGEPHAAAQGGAMMLTDEDRELGRQAVADYAEHGDNPAGWAVDEAKWKRAKQAATEGGYTGDTYWAVVAHIYRQMGGAIGKGKATHNAGTTEPPAETPPEATNVTRTEAIAYLTTNCSCWKGKAPLLGDAAQFSDADVQALADQHRRLAANAEKCPKCGVTMKDGKCPECGAESKGKEMAENRQTAPVVNAAPVPVATPVTPATLSPEQWLALAPPQMREVWNASVRTHDAVKAELVARLTANVAEARRPAAAAVYQAMTVEQLEQLAPEGPANNGFLLPGQAPTYLGAAGGPVGNAGTRWPEAKDDEGILPMPTMNWAEKVG